jgi:sugar phosphate isomerase/epimerase
LKLDIYSRHLQWLRSPEDVAAAAIEMGFDGLDVTVRPYPGHVDPARVKTDLPLFVSALRKAGASVGMITAPIMDADSPNAEAILDTASALGIRHYGWGTYRYDVTRPFGPQLDALKPRVVAMGRLGEKYGMKAVYHNYSGPTAVGATIVDLLQLMREVDPKYVGFHYDTGHAVESAGISWEQGMRLAGPYIGAMSYKDSVFQAAGADVPRRASPPRGAGQGGTNGWRPVSVPLGTGMVDLAQVAHVLKDISFNGPVEIQPEYPNGEANNGADKITLPRETVLGAMKKDQIALRASLAALGLA